MKSELSGYMFCKQNKKSTNMDEQDEQDRQNEMPCIMYILCIHVKKLECMCSNNEWYA